MKLVLLRRIIGLALLSCSLTAARLPAEDGATPTARVDGEVVTLEEVKGPIASRIGLLREEIYQLQRQRLYALIADWLIDKEASRRGVSAA